MQPLFLLGFSRHSYCGMQGHPDHLLHPQQQPQPHQQQQECRRLLTVAERAAQHVRWQWRQEQQRQQQKQQQQKWVDISSRDCWRGERLPVRLRLAHQRAAASLAAKRNSSKLCVAPVVPAMSSAVSLIGAPAATPESVTFHEAAAPPSAASRSEAGATYKSKPPPATQGAAWAAAADSARATWAGVDGVAVAITAVATSAPVACASAAAAASSSAGRAAPAAGTRLQLPAAAAPALSCASMGSHVGGCEAATTAPSASLRAHLAAADGVAAVAAAPADVGESMDFKSVEATPFAGVLEKRRMLLPWGLLRFTLLLLLWICSSCCCCLLNVANATAVDAAGATAVSADAAASTAYGAEDTAAAVVEEEEEAAAAPFAAADSAMPVVPAEASAELREEDDDREGFDPSRHTPEVLEVPAGRPLRFVFGSCNLQPLDDEWQVQEENKLMWNFIHSRRPKVFAWLGDNIYVDTRKHFKLANTIRWQWGRLPWKELLRRYKEVIAAKRSECTEEEIRDALRRQYHNPPYQRLLRSGVRVVGMYDDHDLGADNPFKWHSLKYEARDALLDFIGVAEDSPRRSVKWSGAFYSHQISLSPFPSSASSASAARALPRGSRPVTVRLILVDVRFNRDSWMFLPHGDLLGEQQWRWLEEELRRAKEDCDALVFVASSIEVLPPSAVTTEAWSLFPATRQRLLDRILNAGLQMPVLLSGDVHFAEFTSVLCRPLLLPEDMHRQQGSRQQQLHHHRLYKTPFSLFGRHPSGGATAAHASAAAGATSVGARRFSTGAVGASSSTHTQEKKPQQPLQCPAPGLSLEQVLGGSILEQQQQSMKGLRQQKMSSTAVRARGMAKLTNSSSSSVKGRCAERNGLRDSCCPSVDSSRLHVCDQQQQQQQKQMQQDQVRQPHSQEQQQERQDEEEDEETERLKETDEEFSFREKWTPWEETGLLGRLFPTSSFLISYVYVHLIAPAFFSLLAPHSYLLSSQRQQQEAAAAAAVAAADHREELAGSREGARSAQLPHQQQQWQGTGEQLAAGLGAASEQQEDSDAVVAAAAAVRRDAAGGTEEDGAATAALGAVELSEFTSSGMTHGIEETLLTFRLPTLWANYMLKQGLQRHSIQRDAYYGERLVYIYRNVEEVEFIVNPVADIFLPETNDSDKQQQHHHHRESEEDEHQQQQYWDPKPQAHHAESTADLAGGDKQSYTLFLSDLQRLKPLQCSSSSSSRRRSSAKFRKAEAAAAVHAAAQYFAGNPGRFEALLQLLHQLVQHHEKKDRQRQHHIIRGNEKEEQEALPSRKLNITPRKHWGACCGDGCRHRRERQHLQQQNEKSGESRQPQQQQSLWEEAAEEEEEEDFLRETIWCWETSPWEPGGGDRGAYSGGRAPPQEIPPPLQRETDHLVDYSNRPGPPYPLLDAAFFSLLFLVEEIAQHTIARAALGSVAAAAAAGAATGEFFTFQGPPLHADGSPSEHKDQQWQAKEPRHQEEPQQMKKPWQDKPAEQQEKPAERHEKPQRQRHHTQSSKESQAWRKEIEFYCSITTSAQRRAVTPLLRHVQKQQRALAGYRQQQQQQQAGLKKQQEQEGLREGPPLEQRRIVFEEENCESSRGRREEVQRCQLLQMQLRRNAQLMHVSRSVCTAAGAAVVSSDATDIELFRQLLPQLHESFKAIYASAAAVSQEAAGGASKSCSAAASTAACSRSPCNYGSTSTGPAGELGPAAVAAGRAAAGVKALPEEKAFSELLVEADMEGFSCEEIEDLFRGRVWASIRLYALPFGELVVEKLLSPAVYQRQQRQALALLVEQQQQDAQHQEELQQEQAIHWVCEPAAGTDHTEAYVAVVLSVLLTVGFLGFLLLLVQATLFCHRIVYVAAVTARSRSLLDLGPTWFFLLKRQPTESKALLQQQLSGEEVRQKEATSDPQQQEIVHEQQQRRQ